MSIDWYEQEPIRPEPYRGLDIRVDRSGAKDAWTLSFSTENELERSAYKQALDLTMKWNTFHLERVSGEDDIEQRWEISGVPEDAEKEDFDSIIKDIQDRANNFLEDSKLAA